MPPFSSDGPSEGEEVPVVLLPTGQARTFTLADGRHVIVVSVSRLDAAAEEPTEPPPRTDPQTPSELPKPPAPPPRRPLPPLEIPAYIKVPGRIEFSEASDADIENAVHIEFTPEPGSLETVPGIHVASADFLALVLGDEPGSVDLPMHDESTDVP